MKLPRDIKGADLVRALAKRGYQPTRQTGSHVRLTSTLAGEHHITVPAHDPIKVGTLAAILRDIGEKHALDRDTLIRTLF